MVVVPIPEHQDVIKKSQPEKWVGARPGCQGFLLRKRLAKGGAHLVPMATPLIWLKKLSWNLNVLSRMTIFNRSLAKFLMGLYVAWGGEVGNTRCKAIVHVVKPFLSLSLVGSKGKGIPRPGIPR